MISQLDFFERQKAILEKLFPAGWFNDTSNSNHPAFERWTLCDHIIRHGSRIQLPQDNEFLLSFARICIDTSNLIVLTGGNQDLLLLGDLNLYADGPVQRKIKSRLPIADQFEDILVELNVGACHKANNHLVKPLETKGFPDLQILVPGVTVPIFGECKNLHVLSENRINKIVQKANQQLKAPDIKAFGVLFIDVTTPVDSHIVQSDDIPPRLAHIRQIVEQAISGEKNRSVGTVILMWDDYIILGQPPSKTQVAFRRKYLQLQHSSPDAVKIPPGTKVFESYTVLYTVYWSQAETVQR